MQRVAPSIPTAVNFFHTRQLFPHLSTFPTPVNILHSRQLSGSSLRGRRTEADCTGSEAYLTESAYKVFYQKSIPAQIRQLVPYSNNNQE